MHESVIAFFAFTGLGVIIGSWAMFVVMAHRPWRTVKLQLPEGEYQITSAGPIEIESVDA